MSSARGPQSLRILLGLSLLTGLTSVSIEHNHQGGGLPHPHGFAFVRACGILHGTWNRKSGSNESVRHHHILLAGIEVYSGEEDSGSSPPSPLPLAPACPQVTFWMGADLPNDTLSPASLPLDDCSLFPRSFVLPGATPPSDSPIHQFLPTLTDPRCGLCDCSWRERSGVSLT
jgi:hypothetical protein